MYVDTKLSAFKSFISENKLNNGGIKTTIDQSAVAAGDNVNVDLNLNSDEGQENINSKKKKKDKKKPVNEKKNQDNNARQSDAELKSLNLRRLNLL